MTIPGAGCVSPSDAVIRPPSDSGPDFSVMDYNLTAYLPIGRRNTWVFNYLRSDAMVSRQGETDPAGSSDQNGDQLQPIPRSRRSSSNSVTRR